MQNGIWASFMSERSALMKNTLIIRIMKLISLMVVLRGFSQRPGLHNAREPSKTKQNKKMVHSLKNLHCKYHMSCMPGKTTNEAKKNLNCRLSKSIL